MIPKCCQRCLKRLEPTEREVCSASECLAWKREEKLGTSAFKPAVLRKLFQLWDDYLSKEGPGAAQRVVLRFSNLKDRIEAHPWDDASVFLSELEKVFAPEPPAPAPSKPSPPVQPKVPPPSAYVPQENSWNPVGQQAITNYDCNSAYPRGMVEQAMEHQTKTMEKVLETSQKMMELITRQMDRTASRQEAALAKHALKSPCGNPIDSKRFGVGDIVHHVNSRQHGGKGETGRYGKITCVHLARGTADVTWSYGTMGTYPLSELSHARSEEN